MLSTERRRALGAFYTPPDVARRLVDITVEGMPGPLRVCDPACGDGAFLLAAADALAARGIDHATIARDLLWGCDVDADAAAVARTAVERWGGASPGDHIRVADGLDDIGWSGRFDVVVGNPPFLNQLERATVRTNSTRWAVGPYTDTAFLFLVAGLDLVRDHGRVMLVQPQSLVAARDAKPIREAISAVVGMWTCDERIFDAAVHVCAPLLVRGAVQPDHVHRWKGRHVEPARPAVRGDTWSRLLVRDDEPPEIELSTAGRLGDIASATAGFRQQFYGLAPHAIDEAAADERRFPRLVTCGVIDPGRCAWGERPLRFAGRKWLHPRIDIARIDEPSLRRWVDDRLVPKVVLATQTKVLEVAVDPEGILLPSTPVIAVHTDDLYAAAAVLHAPPVSAWAASTYTGVALASDAIKLSARQALDIPLPADSAKWADASEAFRAGEPLVAAELMTEAYGCDPAVMRWWANRWQPD